ncbi:MAG: oxygenase MpaB family protein [Thermomicrobiales bacterium]
MLMQSSFRAGCTPAAARPGVPVAVTPRVNRETVLVFGWGRALLLHLAHPLVAAGVADHSAFLGQPGERWHRLWRTVEALAALANGTTADAVQAARRVNARHARVQGRLREAAGIFPAGTVYSARDPDLLLWVHAVTVESMLRAHECFVGPLASHEMDQYCAEMGRIGLLLGIPEASIPTCVADLRGDLDTTKASGAITVTGTARALATEILETRAPTGTGALRPLVRFAAVGLLPPEVRNDYGFPWDGRHEAALLCSAALLRRARPLLPDLRFVLTRLAHGYGPRP